METNRCNSEAARYSSRHCTSRHSKVTVTSQVYTRTLDGTETVIVEVINSFVRYFCIFIYLCIYLFIGVKCLGLSTLSIETNRCNSEAVDTAADTVRLDTLKLQ